ncbi:ribonuclease J [Cytobacillus sp.]|uniref:ribonuclease J n=1 Tax=Cytobacillus sp. TaxID=2675269 RepID=UPI0028BDBFDC|nr:ribonuclease J [Cytobacillus sp.]
MGTKGKVISAFSLGGLNEIGKNMYVIEYGNDMIIIDCGNKFPDESLLGIDLIIPDFSYIIENKERVRALIVTHGHEDHIGGVPFVLKEVNVPVYATRFTMGLIELKLREHRFLRESERIEINSDSVVQIGDMNISFFKVNHSIPDCLGIVINTPDGTIVHTGDFKFDWTPVNNERPEIHKMADIGKNGVLLLLSESTNAERTGYTPSEQMVGRNLEQLFIRAKRKVIVSTFASNVSRIQQIVYAAEKTKRKLALLGRSMVNVVGVAMERGYLTIPKGMLIEARDVNHLPPERVTILCTGSQGETLAALSRLSTGNFRDVEILAEDTVIIAAGPIPGNERNVSHIVDNLYKLGAHVIYGSGSSSGIHVSGHGYQEDLRLMLTLMKPKYFIPIHGEYRMLHHHRMLAESVGVEKDNTFLLRNGDVLDIENTIARSTRTIQNGNTYVDGVDIGKMEFVLRDRKQISEEGMLIVIIPMNKQEEKLLSDPEFISRGFVDQNFSELRKEMKRIAMDTINELHEANRYSWNVMKKQIKKSIAQYIKEQTRKEPMIVPILVDI